jgi:hypothetical protein
MMDIRVVRMAVTEPLVHVSMRVWLAGGRRGVVLVPVVLVVVVPVLVLRPLVEVLMLVTLADMKPDANQHERRRQPKPRRDRLAEHDDADHGAHEWRC